MTPDHLRAAGLDPADTRMAQALAQIRGIIGFPRHLSQHMGGFVITQGRLDELCPIEKCRDGGSDLHRRGQGRL